MANEINDCVGLLVWFWIVKSDNKGTRALQNTYMNVDYTMCAGISCILQITIILRNAAEKSCVLLLLAQNHYYECLTPIYHCVYVLVPLIRIMPAIHRGGYRPTQQRRKNFVYLQPWRLQGLRRHDAKTVFCKVNSHVFLLYARGLHCVACASQRSVQWWFVIVHGAVMLQLQYRCGVRRGQVANSTECRVRVSNKKRFRRQSSVGRM